MEYISAEEFLKQPKEIQKVFINWWQPSLGDLYVKDNYLKALPHCVWQSDNGLIFPIRGSLWEEKKKCIPLLTEGQIRKFIENKTGGIIKVIQWNPSIDNEKYGYTIYILAKDEYKVQCTFGYELLGTNLLQSYWKVALEITKEELNQ